MQSLLLIRNIKFLKDSLLTHLFKVVIVWFFPEMTDLEFWTFMCIVSVFLSLLSYGVILIKDQMIIQVGSHKESFLSKTLLSNIISKWGFQMLMGVLLIFLFVPLHWKTRNLPLSLLFHCYLTIQLYEYVDNISLLSFLTLSSTSMSYIVKMYYDIFLYNCTSGSGNEWGGWNGRELPHKWKRGLESEHTSSIYKWYINKIINN